MSLLQQEWKDRMVVHLGIGRLRSSFFVSSSDQSPN